MTWGVSCVKDCSLEGFREGSWIWVWILGRDILPWVSGSIGVRVLGSPHCLPFDTSSFEIAPYCLRSLIRLYWSVLVYSVWTHCAWLQEGLCKLGSYISRNLLYSLILYYSTSSVPILGSITRSVVKFTMALLSILNTYNRM